MAPLYVLCPHCDFPAVVRVFEREVPRHCRQCRRAYIPGELAGRRPRAPGGPAPRNAVAKRRRLVALRTLLQQRSRRAS